MIQIILTPEQQRLIDESAESVQIVDRHGQIWLPENSFVTEAEIAVASQLVAQFDNLDGIEHGLSLSDLERFSQQSRNAPSAATTLGEQLGHLREKSRTAASH